MIFSNLPIRRKLLLSFFITTGTALLVCFGGMLIEEHASIRLNMSREASSLADTIAITSTAALSFQDEKACKEILQSLNAHPHVDAAALFTRDGIEAARFVRNGHDSTHFENKVTLRADSRHIHVVRPVAVGPEILGTLYLRYSLTAFNESLKTFVILTVFVIAASLLISWIVATRLTRQIVTPIEELNAVVEDIAHSGNYSLRVTNKQSDDEIGTLIRCINTMLEYAQMRDNQLLENQEQLETLVRERTAELERTNINLMHEIEERAKSDELRQQVENELLKHRKLESIGVLAGGIAHNFNNILTGVVGFISLARCRSGNNLQIQDYLTKAENACFRAKGLTQQMLTFAKGGNPQCKPVLISEIIKESIDISLAGSNVRCIVSEIPAALITYADTSQMVQVFNNLLMNACQAMEQGGIVNISTDTVDVSPASALNLAPGKYISISVADHGVGIPSEDIQKIFDPYFTTKPSGSGLGLATCYSILKKHKGAITAASVPNEGTTFTLYLPLFVSTGSNVDSSFESTKVEYVAATGNKNMLRILLMDDEEIIRDAAAEMIRDMGHEIMCVEDGSEAVAQYRQAMETGNRFDITILDITVPGGMGGKEACEKILGIDSTASVVVSSGYSHEDIMYNYSRYGFVKSIPKPYSYYELVNLINSLS